MVSTCSKVGVSKEPETRLQEVVINQLDLATILEGQAKMQQEFANFKKRNIDEMEALRQQNTRLKRRIEADANQKGKEKEDSKIPECQPTEEESEYNLTPHTFTTTTLPTHHTPINHTTTLPTHHTPTLPIAHIPPHHYTNTFPTIIWHPIPAHPHKCCHPFIVGITETPLPNQWEAFTLEHYAGDTDPDEHVKIYVTHVGLYTNEDVVMCKAFPTILKGPNLKWFTFLPPYSIDYFDTLFHLFTT